MMLFQPPLVRHWIIYSSVFYQSIVIISSYCKLTQRIIYERDLIFLSVKIITTERLKFAFLC